MSVERESRRGSSLAVKVAKRCHGTGLSASTPLCLLESNDAVCIRWVFKQSRTTFYKVTYHATHDARSRFRVDTDTLFLCSRPIRQSTKSLRYGGESFDSRVFQRSNTSNRFT
jgi:hypothetical protein